MAKQNPRDHVSLEGHTCGHVDASEFVHGIVDKDFRSVYVDDRHIEEIALMYEHLVVDQCKGCTSRVGDLLREYTTGNPKFTQNLWRNNLVIIQTYYQIDPRLHKSKKRS